MRRSATVSWTNEPIGSRITSGRGRGAPPETKPARHGEPVGVLLERSADAIVVLLAILKAGHAYLPLDPASPPARIAALAEQAGLAFVVTRQELVSLLPATHVAVLAVDAESDRIGRGR